jgi:dTDP-glucose pyrophosphorylase
LRGALYNKLMIYYPIQALVNAGIRALGLRSMKGAE